MLKTEETVKSSAETELSKIPTFSQAERQRRWNLAQRLMDEQGLRALIVYGSREGAFPAPFSMDTYFTNDRPGAIVVFPRSGEPVSLVFALAVADHMQASARHEDVWIRSQNLFGGAPVGSALVRILKKLGLERNTIGVIGLEPYPPFYFDGPMPYTTWKTILESLPQATFKPVARRFFEMIAPRSEEEIEVLKWSAAVGEKMCEAMREAVGPGVSESDIYAAILEACPRNVGLTGEVLLGSGPEYTGWGPPSWSYRPKAPRVIQEGDVVLAEVFSSLGMLETQHQPTVAVGKTHPDFDTAADAARESYEVGLNALRPGRRFGEVVREMEIPIRKAGGWNIHPLIHGINPYGLVGSFGEGLAKQPVAVRYGRVGIIETRGERVVLQPGMTFSVEPSCIIGKRMVNLGGTVVLGPDGPIELSHLSTRLMHA
jgi:Xaa-Pro dipeptidase